MSTQIRRAAAAASCLALLCAAAPAAAHQPAPSSKSGEGAKVANQLRAAKRATARFRDVREAREAGYVAGSPCVAEPGRGGMGIHYFSAPLVGDPKVSLRKPEVLVYAPTRGGGLRLVALEYVRIDGDQDLSTADDRPRLFGRGFDGPMEGHAPGEPIHYDLHVWLFKRNPAGLFAQYNPRVSC